MSAKKRDAARAAQLASRVRVTDATIAGRHGEIPVRRYLPPGATRIDLVWVHGGAFSHGGLDQLESHAVAAALAGRGLGVVAVDYRRVPPWSWFRDPAPGVLPGVRFPVPLDDVEDAFRVVQERHPAVALGGASAGACLSAAAALRLARGGGVVPRRLVLAYGTFHAELPAPSPALRARLRGRHGLVQFRPSVVQRMNRNYAGSAEAVSDPFAFPGGHDLTGMPPTSLLDADRDALRASSEAFAGDLDAVGTPVSAAVVPETTHGFLDRPSRPGFDDGIDAIASYSV